MIKFIFCLITLITFNVSAQIKSTILDSVTKEPIPYVNISTDGNIQFSADENGSFTIQAVDDSQLLYFSAVGYSNAVLKASEINDTIYLSRQTIELQPAIISSKKKENKFIVNPIKKAKETFFGYAGGLNGSLMPAVLIRNKESSASTLYIDKIRLKIRPEKDNIFNLRLLEVNPDGSPGNYLYDENIMVSVKKGQKYAAIDFSNNFITIPKEGMFVVIEHIAIRANRLGEIEGIDKFPAHQYAYGPGILCEFSDAKGGWSYKDGKWQENSKTEKGHAKIVVEVTLTD